MIRKILCLLILVANVAWQKNDLKAQLRNSKPLIDSSVYDKWPTVGGGVISNDGNYTFYTIDNQPVGRRTLVLQAIKSNWKIEIPNVNSNSSYFSQDNRIVFFTKPNDSLGIATLGSSIIEYIPKVVSYKLPKKDVGVRLAYQLNTPEKDLILQNVVTGKQKSFAGVTNYLFSDDGNTLLILTESNKENLITQSLKWVDLVADNINTIWSSSEGEKASNITFDKSNTQLVFTVENRIDNKTGKSFWYYNVGTDKAIQLTNNHSAGIDSDLRLGNIQSFNGSGTSLFFSLKEEVGIKPKPNAVQVNVWSYTDAILQSQQLKEIGPKAYQAVIHIKDRRIIRLEKENERLSSSNFPIGNTDDLRLIVSTKGNSGESNWSTASLASVFLVSIKDGIRKRINEKGGNLSVFSYKLSPGGRFIIYYDVKEKNYLSYEVSSGIVRNITKDIPVALTSDSDLPPSPYSVIPEAGWLSGDSAVLLYDHYDIWQVDMKGVKTSVNLTNGYGRRHNIVFRILKDDDSNTITSGSRLILSAVNKSNKNNGFYSKVLGETGDPELLTMGSFLYCLPKPPPGIDGGNPPKRANNAGIYLVSRESSTESRNYFSTADFKIFTRLSDIRPEKNYNWLNTELVTWKTLDGSLSQGILYKPENFDSKKKYPLVFYYYQQISDALNAYLKPEPSGGTLNIAWYVSNGYLVFTPDIHYKLGEPGQSVYNAVVSAANYLSKLPFVDAKKMGIQGHSFGGFETNYLVTHTNLFSAACSADGVTDVISSYGRLKGASHSAQGYYETGQGRMGCTLWQRPDLYIKNSPVLMADKVETPFLLMHTTVDDAVDFIQAIEFFTALRRLGKRAWLLEYNEGNHGVDGKSGADFTIRMAQFFDHYLKGAPAPKWMTKGIPAKMKGIDDGLQLDSPGISPGPGLRYDIIEGNKK